MADNAPVGIGMTPQVSGHDTYLHDGRARSLIEAIPWRHGEARGTRNGFVDVSAEDRAALFAFLESL